MQESQQAPALYLTGQDDPGAMPMGMALGMARPGSAAQTGPDTASASAAKLLDQIGRMSSLETQVRRMPASSCSAHAFPHVTALLMVFTQPLCNHVIDLHSSPVV